MGACLSNKSDTKENVRNQQINRYILEQKEKEETKSIRILLLGTGDSGKTTFVKQLKKIHHCISIEAKQQSIPLIHHMIVRAMKVLCTQSLSIGDTDNQAQISKTLENDTKILLEYYHSPRALSLPENIAQIIDQLWKDPAIQYIYKFRKSDRFEDNGNYFLDKVLGISNKHYVPTDEDYIHLRSTTTGIVEETFSISDKNFIGNNHEFIFVDVGGQKTERKKWLTMPHDNLKCVLYVVGIGDYDMVCFEDTKANRLQDSLALFSTVLSNGFMDNKSLVLFFNKNDLFVKKICEIPITITFSDYPSHWNPHDEFQVIQFIYNKFLTLYQSHYTDGNGSEKNLQTKLHMHRTCALDTNQTEKVMTDVQSDLLKLQLRSAGML